MREDILRALAAIKLSSPIAPAEGAAVRAVLLPFHEQEPYRELRVARDEQYGPNARHRLDIFAPQERSAPRPVVLFVHGGAYIGGDKRTPGTPYNDNVGVWAARSGFIGVTMNYRLAPAHPYPAGAEDVGAAVEWIRANIASYGGDPDAVTLLGQSAGATHVACYGARSDLHARPGGGVNGIVLMSGSYEFSDPNPGPHTVAYFGNDAAARAGASCIRGLVESGIPVMISVSEHDAPGAHRQAWLMAQAFYDAGGRCPNFMYLPNHNHVSQIAHLNADGIDDTLLGDRLADFVTRCARLSLQPAST
jgi:acetyl esterase/lipase